MANLQMGTKSDKNILKPLIELRIKLGAPLANVSLDNYIKPISPHAEELQRNGSIVIENTDILQKLGTVGGLLAFEGIHVTLHICDPNVLRVQLEQVPAENPKYHLVECTTLYQMRAAGRFNRYIVSSNKDGKFRVRPMTPNYRREQDEMNAVLLPCKHCLKKLGRDDSRPEEFDLADFFATHASTFRSLPRYTPGTIGAGEYTSDWHKVSTRIRDRAGWKCQECSVNCSNHKELLHVHHIDGNKGNNRTRNLKALCICCHAKQPMHGGMGVSSEARRIISRLRDEQLL